MPTLSRFNGACAAVLLFAPIAAIAQGHEHGAATSSAASAPAAGFGQIDFRTSASAPAHAAFERGVLFLHNFHYPQAVAAFRAGQQLDPGDVMSYWGEAMSYTHPVWNEQDTAAARAALARLAPTREARLGKARTPRERAWLATVEALYAPNGGSKARRDTAFARAMAALHASDPADPEAASFYALSLLGLNQGEREEKAYAQAHAIADSVFHAHPLHPGGAHYVIHAVDDPDHAGQGLEAARAYSTIAPAAGHALHMTSHIFLALGMWDDVVAANVRASATRRLLSGHGVQWLVYGLLQQGRYAEATRWLDSLAMQARTERGLPSTDAWRHMALIAPAWIVDTRRWNAVHGRLTLDTAQLGLDPLSTADFGRGLAALRRGETALADSMLQRMVKRRSATTPALDARYSAAVPVEQLDAARSVVRERTLGALLRAAAGDANGAVAALDSAAVQDELLPMVFGPPVEIYPPREAAGDVLLAAGNAQAAWREYGRALARTPKRPAVLLGLARSARALGDVDERDRIYGVLAAIWHDADTDVPGLGEVRAAAVATARRSPSR